MKRIVLSFVLALIGICCCAQLGNKVSRKALPDSTLIKNILNPISIDIEADMEKISALIREMEMKMPRLSLGAISLDTSAVAIRSVMIDSGYQYVEENEKSFVFYGVAYGVDDAVIGVKKTVDPADMKVIVKTSNSWHDARVEYERVKGLLQEQYGGSVSNEILPKEYIDFVGEGDVGFYDGKAKYMSGFVARKGRVYLYIQYRKIEQQYAVCVHLFHIKS